MSVDHSWRNDPLQRDIISSKMKTGFLPKTKISEENDNPEDSENEEEEELLLGAPLPVTLSVREAAPIVLKPALKTYSQPRKKNPYQTKTKLTSVPPPPQPQQQSQSLQSRDQFFKEGKSKIIGIINEARRLGIDPREYHPFYLRLHKHIADGQRLGYIGIEEEDVEEQWREYDDLIDQVPVKKVYLKGEWENSPYAVFIEKGLVCDRNGRRRNVQRDSQELENRFKELGSAARKISLTWAEEHDEGEEEDDLKARLRFFYQCNCRTMIHPADVIGMNEIWRKFRNDCSRKCEAFTRFVFTFRSGDVIPKEFHCRVVAKDIKKDRMWGSKVRRQLLKRKRANLEFVYSPPSPRSPSFDDPSSPSYSPPLSKKRKRRVVRSSRSSSRNRSRSRSKQKSKPRSKKPVIPLSKEELTKKKLREKRLAKFKRSRGKLKWTLRMTCRRRRHWETLRIRRSDEVTITLEKVISGSCRLRTLKNRKIWIKKEEKRKQAKVKKKILPKSNKKRNSSFKGEGGVLCPHCDRKFKNDLSLRTHLFVMHNIRKGPKRFQKTGQDPKWMEDEDGRRGPGRPSHPSKHKSVVCDQCGRELFNQVNLRNHVRKVHNPNNRSRCPKCEEIFSCGARLWFHFLAKHLNYDVLELAKAKAEKMGLIPTTPAPAPTEPQEITKVINDAGLEEFRCDICGKTFEFQEIARRHVIQVHKGERHWLCDACGKTFKAKDNRDAHYRQVHEGQDYKCDICGRKTQSKGKLWRHKVEVHEMTDLEPPEGLTIEVCRYCGASMLRGLQAHVKKQHPEKLAEFVASVKAEQAKGSAMPNKGRLNYKKLRQEQERKWKEEGILEVPWIAKSVRPKNKCPFCGMSMNEIKNWRKHLGEVCEGTPSAISKKDGPSSVRVRKWVCPVEGCKKDFYRIRQLDGHIMRHSNAYANLEKKNLVKMVEEDEFAPCEFHCLLCKEEEVKMVSKGELIIHFVLNHPKVYNEHRGELEPEVDETGVLAQSNPNTEQLIRPPQPPPPTATVTAKATATAAVVEVEDPPLVKLKQYPCPHCSVELFSDFDLRCHIEVTHQDKCWRCPDPTCTKVILSPDEMEKHFMEDHKDF